MNTLTPTSKQQKTAPAADLDALIKGLQEGQITPEALVDSLMREHYGGLYRFALAVLDDPTRATFVTLDTLVEVARKAGQRRDGASSRLWMYTIALHRCRKEHHHLKRERWWKAVLPVHREEGDFGYSIPTSFMEAEIWLAIDTLDEPARIACLLIHLLNWTGSDTADLLGVSEVQVIRWQKQVRKKLVEKLTPFALPPEELEPDRLDVLLSRSLKARWTVSGLTDEEAEVVKDEVLAQVGKK